jgi:hypothetical protein
VREKIISTLKPFAEACFRFAGSISPGTAAFIYVLVLLALAVWVLTLKQEGRDAGDGSKARRVYHDLRTWAVAILIVQALIYVVFR